MKFTEFASIIRQQTRTDSVTFTDAEILVLANAHKSELAERIANEVAEDYFVLPLTANLVAGQREYALPSDLLVNIKIVEVQLDGTNWKRAWDFDLNSYRRPSVPGDNPLDLNILSNDFSSATTDETTIQNAFTDENPMFDTTRSSIVLYTGSAIAAVTGGLKIQSAIYPADFTDLTLTTDMSIDPSSTSIGWPRPFHLPLAKKVIISYKTTNRIDLTAFDQTVETEVARALKNLSRPNLDRVIVPRVPEINDSNF